MYYPKSQVKTNLYTNGGEYVRKDTGEDYTGFYYEVSTGEKYIGKTPKGMGSILLIPPPLNTPDDITYNKKFVRLAAWQGDADPIMEIDPELNDFLLIGKYAAVSPQGIPTVRKIPQPIHPMYTLQDQSNGEYYRYFAKKSNQFIYYDISKEDYNLLKQKDPKIAFDLYQCEKMWWSIGQENSFLVNSKQSKIIESNLNWFGFSQYIQSPSSPRPLLKPQIKPTPSLSTPPSTPSSTTTSTTSPTGITSSPSFGGGSGY